MSAASVPDAPGRRHDLDWIRVGAFLLLILYHVGMVYVPWDFHVNSPRPVEALEPVMMLVNPWRLTLLFLVSGAATRFLVDGFAARGGRISGSTMRPHGASGAMRTAACAPRPGTICGSSPICCPTA